MQSGRVKRECEKVLETKYVPSKIHLFQNTHAVGRKNALNCRAISVPYLCFCVCFVTIRKENRIQFQSVIYDFKQNTDYLGGAELSRKRLCLFLMLLHSKLCSAPL